MKIDMNANDLNSTILDVFIKELHNISTDMSDHLKKLQETVQSVRNSSSDIVEKIGEKLNLDDILSSINDFWVTADNESSKLIQQLEDSINPVKNKLSDFVQPIRVALYCIGGVFVVMLVIALLIGARLLYRAFKDHLYGDPGSTSVGEFLTC